MASDLIPSINWTDLCTIVKAGRIKDLMSCEVNYNQETIFTITIYRGDPFTDANAKERSERVALLTNSQGGKSPEQLLAQIEEERCAPSSSSNVKPVGGSRRRGNTKKSRKSVAQFAGVR